MKETFLKDNLTVKIYETRDEMGKCAAADIAECMRKLLSVKEEINMIFAAAPSQNDMLWHLCNEKDIDWNRVNAFHMDEYIGLSKDAPQGFGNFLREHIFSKKNFKSINYIKSDAADAEDECERYSALLKRYTTDIVCMGIGENGHIAFNDPHVAFFDDEKVVKAVTLDDICRRQQVNDGCFARIEDVPKQALTLTIPTLTKAKYLFCVVPAATKAQAVKNTIEGVVSEKCPASILRRHENAILYCDSDSAQLIG